MNIEIYKIEKLCCWLIFIFKVSHHFVKKNMLWVSVWKWNVIFRTSECDLFKLLRIFLNKKNHNLKVISEIPTTCWMLSNYSFELKSKKPIGHQKIPFESSNLITRVFAVPIHNYTIEYSKVFRISKVYLCRHSETYFYRCIFHPKALALPSSLSYTILIYTQNNQKVE